MPSFFLQMTTTIQEWSGVILQCSATELTARLQDVTTPSNPDELVVIDIETIPKDDQELIEPGAPFHWSIHRKKATDYSTTVHSKITIASLGYWTKADIEAAALTASHWESGILKGK